ncbi:hypothetical protein [Rhizobacter sp. Root1221]|uniref:hypothetical protein n=1 Tax=Rhizobacter sp. Root1221 TaxID=1736433 RepID=UPI0006FC9FD7|nr:hypothetical protein [Rhizobacter sp. Root1221]KQV94751.1 hypothetical protein ASC87_25920 [Rhizobacter sp. Root1221]
MSRSNRIRLGVLLCGLAVAGYLALFGDKTPNGVALAHDARPRPAASAASSPAPRPKAPGTAREAPAASPTIERLKVRSEMIDAGRVAASAPADLFASRSWTPPPPPPPPVVVAPPPRPTPPPVPFTYMGKKLEAGTWEVYLARGELSYIVREGTQLEGQYLVQQVRPPIMTLKYLPLNESQMVAIGESE